MTTETQHLQDLSASVDGELAQDELRFLLRRLDRDAALCETWSRYQLIGESLRGHLTVRAADDFSARVLAQIENESAAAVHAPASQRWLRWSMGGAIAASVAVAALMLGQPSQLSSGGDQPTASVPAVNTGMSVAAAGTESATPAVAPLGAPAAVPTWLHLDSASQLSQRAAATRSGPANDLHWIDEDNLPGARQARYPAIRTGQDSYLLLLDPHAAHGQAAGAGAR